MNKFIEIEGEFINFSGENHIIRVDVYGLLGELDSEDIADYAADNLDMKHIDDFQSDLDDFSEYEIVEYLKDDGFDFSEEVDYDDMIEALERKGYEITAYEDIIDNGLDIIDANRLDEIINLFINSSFAEREEIYKKCT